MGSSKDRGASDALILISISLVAILVGLGIWALSVALSPTVGKGEAFKQKESANNRVFAQQYFQETANEIKATQAKITFAAKVKDPTPEQATRYEGLQSYCTSLVGQYNAKSESYLSEQFKDADLPVSFTSTDCEPTA